jgi:hypothetical protein
MASRQRTQAPADLLASLVINPGCACEKCSTIRTSRAVRQLPAELVRDQLEGLRTGDAREVTLLAVYDPPERREPASSEKRLLAAALPQWAGPALEGLSGPDYFPRYDLWRHLGWLDEGLRDAARTIREEPAHAPGHVDVYVIDRPLLVRHCAQCDYGLPPLAATLPPPRPRRAGEATLLADGGLPPGLAGAVRGSGREVGLLAAAALAAFPDPALLFVHRPPQAERDLWVRLARDPSAPAEQVRFASGHAFPRARLAEAVARAHPDAAEAILDPSLIADEPGAIPAVFACQREVAVAAFRFEPAPLRPPPPEGLLDAVRRQAGTMTEVARQLAARDGWPASGLCLLARTLGPGLRAVMPMSREAFARLLALEKMDGSPQAVFDQHEEPGHIAVASVEGEGLPTRKPGGRLEWVGCSKCDLGVELGDLPPAGGRR